MRRGLSGSLWLGGYPSTISSLGQLKTWPRIHERSAREKISTDQVAHVLNDEVSRKYIQSLKRLIPPKSTLPLDLTDSSRLLTFSQTKYPPDDVTQLMG